MNRIFFQLVLAACVALNGITAFADDMPQKHGFVESDGIKIHYVTQGEGPLVVMIHGFPDFWYSWRKQMPELAKHFQVVAIDQRGYNKSGQPKGVEAYQMKHLVADVANVIKHFKVDKATVVGHDWGGAVAWSFAMAHPEMTEKLVILNLPHLHALQRELANNPQQSKNSQYARNFQIPGAHRVLTATALASWVKDKKAREKYVEAFKRSSMEGMLNYYKANYPRPPYKEPKEKPAPVKCSVLMMHGLKDKYLLAGALNDTWTFLESDLTLITVPDSGHFIQQEKPEFVTREMLRWLLRDQKADSSE